MRRLGVCVWQACGARKRKRRRLLVDVSLKKCGGPSFSLSASLALKRPCSAGETLQVASFSATTHLAAVGGAQGRQGSLGEDGVKKNFAGRVALFAASN